MNPFYHIQEYLDKNPSLQCVPVNGKAPITNEWQNVQVTEEIITSWEETLVGKATGFGLRAGQHNIGWMDVDTDDMERNYRIDTIMDLSNICTKRGLKGKTVFFRYEGTPKKSKYNIYGRENRKKPIVEFNFTSGQTVLPPSLHPETGAPYKWLSQSLLDIDIEDLPIIDEAKIEHLEEILNASSLVEGLKLVPTGVTGDGSGKWKTITSEASRLLHLGIDDSGIAKTLIGMDRRLHEGNQFFFSSKIGKDLISKTDDFTNAVAWVASYKSSILRTDPELRATMAKVARVSEAVTIHGEWPDMKPLLNSKQVLEFPDYLFPDAFRDYCKDLGKRSALPPEAYLTAIFTTFSATCQAKVTIHAKSDFQLHPSISTMIVAPSGSRKDAIFDAATAPLNKIVDALLDNVDSTFIENEKNVCAGIEALNSRRKKAINEKDTLLVEELTKEIISEQSKLMGMKELKPDFIFESGTQEKLYELSAKNQKRGIFLRASEYVHLMGGLNKKGNEALRGFYLKLLNGSTSEKFNHQTKTGTNVNIRKVVGCALVGAQTDVLAQDIREMEVGKQADGLLQRFFIINIDPEIRMMEDFPAPVNSARIDNLFHLMYHFEGEIHAMWENDEAKKCYMEYDFALRKSIEFERSVLKSFKSKYSGHSIKLAWIYEQANCPPGKIATKISKKSFLLAVEFLEWASRNLDVAWSNVNYNTGLRSAEAIITAIRNGGIRQGQFQKDALQITKLNHTDFAIGVDMLIANNYIRRTGDKYESHPCI